MAERADDGPPEPAPFIVHVPAYVGDTLSNVAVDVRKDALPDVFNLLKGEAAPLRHWVEVALAYYRHGLTESYESVMKEASENMNFLDATPADKLAILNSLCAHYTNHIHRAVSKQNDKLADWYLDKVKTLNSQAMQIDAFNPMVFATNGFAFLARGNIKSATGYFDLALNTLDPKNLPSLVGKAVIAYQEKNDAKALDYYSMALKANPNCPGFVRLGMAYCWYRLKDVEKAKLCFQRVVDLEPNNVSALVGLALVDLDIRNKVSFERSVKYLKRAFALQANHPMVLNTFADHLFHNQYALNAARKVQGLPPGPYDKSEELATKAAESALNAQVKALAWYQIGRAHHADGDFSEALNNYFQAVSIFKELPLAHYGLGQMYVWKGQPEAAAKHLREVLALAPEDRDTLLALGQLYVQQGKEQEAVRVLRKLTDQHKDIPQAWILYGFCTRHDHEFALRCYAKAVRLLKSTAQDVDHRVWSDVGALHHLSGYEEDAERMYTTALHKAGGTLEKYEMEHVPIITNLARLREDQGRLEDSVQILRKLAEGFPAYLEPYLGLARIHLKMKDKAQAARWLELAMEVAPSRAEPWLMLADTYSSQKEWIRAQEKYEHVLNSISRTEAHAQLGMGFIYLNALQHASLPNKVDRYSKLAADFYQKVLQTDGANVYAAHGLGCYLAFRGHYDAARRVLARVSQASLMAKEDNASDTMLVNYANTHCMVGNYGTAAKMYLNIIKRFPGSTHSLHALLGQALFYNGEFKEAVAALSTAVKKDPDVPRLWFNLGLAQLMLALQLLSDLKIGTSQQIRASDYETAESAVNLLTQAQGIFQRTHDHYAEFPKHPLYKFSQTHVSECHAHLANAAACLERARAVRGEAERRVARYQAQQRELEAKRKEAEERQAAEQRRREEAMRQLMAEEDSRLEDMRRRFIQQEEAAQEQLRRKEAQKGRPSGDRGARGPDLQVKPEGSVVLDDDEDRQVPTSSVMSQGEGGPERKRGRDPEGDADRRAKEKKRRHRPPAESGASATDIVGSRRRETPEERAARKGEKRRRKEEKRREKEDRLRRKSTRGHSNAPPSGDSAPPPPFRPDAATQEIPETEVQRMMEMDDDHSDDSDDAAEMLADEAGDPGSVPRKRHRIAGSDDEADEAEGL